MVQQYNLKGGFFFGTATQTGHNITESGETVLAKYFEFILDVTRVTIELFSEEGISGIILVVNFKEDYLQSIQADMFVIRDYCFNPCKRLLFKLCYIDPNLEGNDKKSFDDKQMMSKSSFENEVKIQQHVFRQTNAHLQPITPLIYFHKIYDTKETIEFLNKILTCCSRDANNRLQHLHHKIYNYNLNLGVILMEMRDGYSTAYSIPDINSNKNFLAMTAEVLNRLHHACSVTHGDLHQNNILIETQQLGYYTPYVGNILLIDWGSAKNQKIHNNSTLLTIEPVVEVTIELDETRNPRDPYEAIFWSYEWLIYKQPTILAPHPVPDWGSREVAIKSIELRAARRQNYVTLPQLPAYFFQPEIITNWGVTWPGGGQEGGKKKSKKINTNSKEINYKKKYLKYKKKYLQQKNLYFGGSDESINAS